MGERTVTAGGIRRKIEFGASTAVLNDVILRDYRLRTAPDAPTPGDEATEDRLHVSWGTC